MQNSLLTVFYQNSFFPCPLNIVPAFHWQNPKTLLSSIFPLSFENLGIALFYAEPIWLVLPALSWIMTAFLIDASGEHVYLTFLQLILFVVCFVVERVCLPVVMLKNSKILNHWILQYLREDPFSLGLFLE